MRRQITMALAALGLAATAMADINSTATLNAGSGLSLDTGSASTSGDILFTGTALNFQGGAKGALVPGSSGSSVYNQLTQSVLQSLVSFGSPSPIPASQLTVGAIVGYQTKGGNVGKLLITASTTASLAFQYTTYGATGGGGGTGAGPTVTAVQNNSSTIPAGFTNSGVAPSTLIVIKGSGLADPNAQASPLQDSSKGLPSTLNGASVSVSAGGKTYPVGMYYAIATQIAGVLPAGVPLGSATLTVSYGEASSAAFSFNVVQSAYGISNYNGNTAVVQDAVTAALITPTASAKPGEIIIIWGTGLGSDSADSDTTQTGTPHNFAAGNVQAYIGGVPVTSIAYAGASVYPGVHVVGLTIPQGVPNGCFVPIVIVTGSVISNTPTIPVMNNGGVCSESIFGINGNQLTTLGAQSSVRTGSVLVGQIVSNGQTNNLAEASFSQNTGSGGTGGGTSLGTCITNETGTGGTSTSVGLDAGSVSVSTPAGSFNLQAIPQVKGTYVAQLPNGAITAGGTSTFTGTGGADVGSFTASVTFPNPLFSWTNQSAAATVTRSAGLLVTWTGGTPGSYVFISGSSSANGVDGSYTCYAPQSAGQFTVPPYVLSILPAGSGSTLVENGTNYTTFSAAHLDTGFGIGFMGVSVNTTVQ
jgi:uncharacterized protein (TIGR03437 family)